MKNLFFALLFPIVLFAGSTQNTSLGDIVSNVLNNTIVISGFWILVGVIFTAEVAVWGVKQALKFFKQA
jgi:hypothetical protein